MRNTPRVRNTLQLAKLTHDLPYGTKMFKSSYDSTQSEEDSVPVLLLGHRPSLQLNADPIRPWNKPYLHVTNTT
jgi:hypothetical protein